MNTMVLALMPFAADYEASLGAGIYSSPATRAPVSSSMKVRRNGAYVVGLMESYMQLDPHSSHGRTFLRARSEVTVGRRKSGCRRSPICYVADPLESRTFPSPSSWPGMRGSRPKARQSGKVTRIVVEPRSRRCEICIFQGVISLVTLCLI
jgi:hypothetical protein